MAGCSFPAGSDKEEIVLPPIPRFRIAPSPTGFAHMGTARTALYNYLLARNMGGRFVLRIEDTDRTRYVPGSVEDVIQSLHALGIQWDEGPDIGGQYGPYFQSQRLQIYHELLHRLVDEGKAYPCFCSAERLEKVRHEQEATGQPSRYDRLCRDIDPAAARRRMAEEPYVIRFRMPLAGVTVVHDMLRGDLSFDNTIMDDHVLLKQRRPGEEYAWPTYHGCSPLDDHLMAITHVVRGDEWLPSTPRYQLLLAAFGWDVPVFTHLPIILSPSGKGKMSKREGATTIREMLAAGYLPEALVNFLLLLGWASGDDRELFTLDEAAGVFTFAGMSKSPAAFNTEKLEWLNGVYIRKLPPEELAAQLWPYLAAAGYVPATPNDADMAYLLRIVPLVQERIALLSEVAGQVGFFYGDMDDYQPELLKPKKTSKEDVSRVLAAAVERVGAAAEFTSAVLHYELQVAAEALGLKAGQVFMPLRVAVSGRNVSPGSTTDIMAVLGKEKTLERLRLAMEKLEKL